MPTLKRLPSIVLRSPCVYADSRSANQALDKPAEAAHPCTSILRP